ncbi:MAG: hypothetical protein HDR88_12590 [Bacteroides sp.]|nr:hypothetical protein [Bacteroides sp.]
MEMTEKRYTPIYNIVRYPLMQCGLIAILMCVVGMLAGCEGSREADRQLAAMEKLIPNHPDSVWKIIEEMDTNRMSDAQKLHMDLLYSYMAVVHGNSLNLDDQTIIECDRLFRGKFNTDEVKWLIIKSDVSKLKGDYIAQIESLKDAEFLAMQLDSKFDLAMVYQNLSSVYKRGYNGMVCKYYAEKAIELLKELNCPKQIRETKMNIVSAYAIKEDYKTMLDSLLAMKDEVMANAHDSYKVFFLDQLARTYGMNGQTEKGIAIWHSIYDGKEMNSNTLAHWADAYCRINKLDSAYMLITQANSLPHNSSDEQLCRNVEYGILEKMGRKSELARIDSLRKVAVINKVKEEKLEERSLIINVKNESATVKAWLEAAKARTRATYFLFAAILSIIAAISIFLYLRKRNQILKLEHENDLLKIRSLQDNLFESDNKHKIVSSKITELFHSRFKLLDSLAASYFESKETGQEQKRIYSDVKSSLNNFSSDASTQELENIVNGYNDNLMLRFREDFPKLSVAQYRLALYLFCGFSLPSISIFTGTELKNIYVYKSRLKGVINKSDAPGKEEYLSYFS